jgi:hypothetical protein
VADLHRARLLVVELHASARVLRARLQARSVARDRHPGHLDHELAAEIPEGPVPQAYPAQPCMQAVDWLRYDTDTLDGSTLEWISSNIAARLTPGPC